MWAAPIGDSILMFKNSTKFKHVESVLYIKKLNFSKDNFPVVYY